MVRKGVLIVGGYGHVGHLIAADLAPRFPGRVTLAGRDGGRARAVANEIGYGAQGIEIDVTDAIAVDAALEGIAVVICCIDQGKPHLLRSAVARGLAYTDLTAELDFWRVAWELGDQAKRTGARVLLGAGLFPGLSNVMARDAVDRAGPGGTLDTAVLLSVGDSFGPAALEWMMGAADRTFTITEHGQDHRVRGMRDKRQMKFPNSFGTRTVHRFAFPDQVFYPETLGVHRAGSWVALEPSWIATVFTAAMRSGFAGVLSRTRLRRGMTHAFRWLQSRYAGRDTYVLAVEAEGPGGTARLGAVGRNASSGTAASAVVMADALIAGEGIDPGVHLPEQVFDPAPFFAALESWGITVQRDHERDIQQQHAADGAARRR